MTDRDKIKQLLKVIPHKLCVEFALYCANDVLKNVSDKDLTTVKECLSLINRWQKGEIIPPSALNSAADSAADSAANSAANSAAYAACAAYAANSAAYAACAAYAANSAAYAACAAYAAYAANSAAYATCAANSAAYAAYAANSAANSAAYEEKMHLYLNHLVENIAKVSKLEKVIYDLESI